MLFITENGSIYELDRDGEKVRRMTGVTNPTPRQGPDGEWKKFTSCSEVRVGHPVLIQWEGVKGTMTSRVTSINTFYVFRN